MREFALQFEMPWLDNDPNRRAREMSLDELVAAGDAIPAGVTARAFTSMLYPPQIPDIIGVEERRYLDHSGLVRQREIGDLMRYSSLVTDMTKYSRHGDLEPQATPMAGKGVRYSDAQLYALAKYLYSLKPPENPHTFDGRASKGKAVFEREGCAGCHTPPLYTNNKLVPVEGFTPQADSPDAILGRTIGLDPHTTLATLKGTGYYKVPSLKGVWYRGPFEHNGSVATLEDWFDAARLREDYRPTGFKGGGVETRAVPGHRFGLDLGAEEKEALIAFLKTL
jgi:mono/diheme cytochrome c family protein